MRGVKRPAWRAVVGPLLAVGSLVLALGAGELVTRLRIAEAARAALPHVGLGQEAQDRLAWRARQRAGGEQGWRLDQPDPLLGWRLHPGVRVRAVKPGSYDVIVTVNRRGLRGKTHVSEKKTAGVPRIGVFGCSQTFGAGVGDTETFSARLATVLSGVEVLNFGVRGYGTDQMLLYYESEGVRYDLDVVVLAFAYYHIARNVSGFKYFAKPRFTLGTDGSLTLGGVPVPGPETLARGDDLVQPWTLADRSILLQWGWQRILLQDERAASRSDSAAWRLTRALIARFAADARRAGSRMILMNIEDEPIELEPVLQALAASLGIDFLNLGRVLGEPRGAGVRLRLPNDAHWGPAGHALIAANLRRHLCDSGAVACHDLPGD